MVGLKDANHLSEKLQLEPDLKLDMATGRGRQRITVKQELEELPVGANNQKHPPKPPARELELMYQMW